MKIQPPTRIRLLSCLATAGLLTAISAAHASYQSAVLTDNPLAYYPLSVATDPTGTTATDLSGNGNNGTYNGTDPQFNNVAGPSANIPSALYFDGFTSFVDLSTGSNPSLLNFGGPITMEAWVQPVNPSQSFGDILAKGYDSAYGYDEVTLRLNGGRYEGTTYDGSNTRGAGGGTPSTNWAYVVSTYDGTKWNFYVNGQLAAQGSDAVGALNFPTPWHIGSGSADGANRLFNGNICQVALYNYGLSSDAVYAHYFVGKYGVTPSNSIPIVVKQPAPQVGYTNGTAVFSVGLLGVLPTTNQWYKNGVPLTGQTNLTLTLSNLQSSDVATYSAKSGNINGSTNSTAVGLTLHALSPYDKTVVMDSPLAYYPLDGAIDSSPLAQDFSGNGNYGTFVNLDPATDAVPGPSTAIPNALTFNGSSAWVDLSQGSQAPLLNFAGPISMEAWVQPANSTSFGDILAKGYDSNPPYQESTLRVNGPYGANYYASSASAAVSGGQQNTAWTHVVLSSDGSRCSLFINGVVAQSTSDNNGSQLFNDPWAIGNGTSAGSTRFFNGNICQVAIYNHGLTTNQVLQHFIFGALGVAASNALPVISSQPQPQTVYAGNTATFSVSTLGILPATNLWFKNGNPLAGQTNSTLVLPNVQSLDAANYSVVVGNSNGKTNSAAASLTVLSAADSLVWTITNNSSYWDSGASANWVNVANSQQVVFNTGDQVLFDDTPGVPTTVYISGTVAPSKIVVSSDNNNFSLNDSGGSSITGSGSLTKNGNSTLSILTPFSLTGPANINGGVVYAGNYAFSSVASITITNSATLDFGGGQLTGPKPVSLSGMGFGGEGALYNSSYEIYGNILNITLTGDSSFGGSSRWDLASGSSIAGAHKLTVNRANSGVYNEWDSVNVATNVGDIELATGKLGLKNMSSTFGSPNSTLIVDGGVELDFWSGGCNRSMHILNNGKVQVFTAPTDFNPANVTLDDNAQFYVYGGSGNQTMNGTYTFAGVAHILMGDANRVYTNTVNGPGGFVVDAWNHQMIFSASNTYSGPTIIGNGPQVALTGNGSILHSSPIFFGGNNPSSTAIDVSGRTDQKLTLANGQTLAGIGAINGSLAVASGATLSPAGTNTTIGMSTGSNPVGIIAASGSVTLNGNTVIKLALPTNDVVQAGTSITYGGTLNLVNISGTDLVAGNTFQVFTAAAYSGSFANISPTTPGANLAWDLSQLSSGKIGVMVPQFIIGNPRIVNGSLVFSGTGGTGGGTYYVLGSTNLATGNWTVVSTNQFDASGNFSATNAFSASAGQHFYKLQK